MSTSVASHSTNLSGNSSSNSTYPLPTGHWTSFDGVNTPAFLAALFVPHAVCTLFIAARIWSRVMLLRKWFLDDSLILAAYLGSTAVCVVYGMAVAGADTLRHRYLLRTYLGLIFYQLCLCLTKLSVLALYLRLFAIDARRPRERRLAWLTVFFVVSYGLPLLAMSILQCHSHAASGSASASSASSASPVQRSRFFFGHPIAVCFSFRPLLVASASLHTAVDAWLIVLVIPCISRLGLPRSQRLALAAVLSLGVFVIAASLTRMQLSLHAHYRPDNSGISNSNTTGTRRAVATLGFFIMTVLECDIALICASAPTLRPLLARLVPRCLGMDHSHRSAAGPLYYSYYRQQHYRRRRRHADANDTDDDDSADLTSVVSYHGYPWTRQHTPTPSAGGVADRPPTIPPVPAVPSLLPTVISSPPAAVTTATTATRPSAVQQRMPARSLCSSAEKGSTGRDEVDAGGPLCGEPAAATAHEESDTFEDDDLLPSGIVSRRPSSSLFLFGISRPGSSGSASKQKEDRKEYKGEDGQDGQAARSICSTVSTAVGLGIVIQKPPQSPRSPRSPGSPRSPRSMPQSPLPPRNSSSLADDHSRRWTTSSQESLVMGLNDPASPTRLTGFSGYSGETITGAEKEGEDGVGGRGEGVDEKQEGLEGRGSQDSRDNRDSRDSRDRERDGGAKMDEQPSVFERSFLDDKTDSEEEDSDKKDLR